MSRGEHVEQRITFCSGIDGRSIACATAGNGPPLVRSPWWVSHLQYEWEKANLRQFLEALAQQHTLIRYDRVGVGLSDRSIAEFTLEAEVRNLEAVVTHHRLERFALFGSSLGAPIAIAFAALLLAAGCATPIGVSPGRQQAVYRELTASVLSNGKLSPLTSRCCCAAG